MNVYVFERIGKVSDYYHEEGGLMIAANSVERAKEMIDAKPFVKVTDEEWAEVLVIAAHPDTEESFITFPDAGCC